MRNGIDRLKVDHLYGTNPSVTRHFSLHLHGNVFSLGNPLSLPNRRRLSRSSRLKPVPLSRMRKLRLLRPSVVGKQSRREFWLNDRFRKRKSTANRPSVPEKLKLNVKFALKRSNSSRSPKSPTRRNRSLLPPNRNSSHKRKRVPTLHLQKR